MMATCSSIDNPSYFTVEGTACASVASSEGAKSKIQRFKWLKIKSKALNKDRVQIELKPAVETELARNLVESQESLKSDVGSVRVESVYYNFPLTSTISTSLSSEATAAPRASAEIDTDDDVFDDEIVPTTAVSGARLKNSGSALRKRRHSLGAWFRTSLSSVRRSTSTSSAATTSTSTTVPSSSCILPGVSSSAVSLTYRPEMKSKSKLPQPKPSSLLTSTSTVMSVAKSQTPNSQLTKPKGSVKSKTMKTQIPAPLLGKTISLGPVLQPRSKISLVPRNSVRSVMPATSLNKSSLPLYCNQRVFRFSGTLSLDRHLGPALASNVASEAGATATTSASHSQASEAAQDGSFNPASKHGLVSEPKIDSTRSRGCSQAGNGTRGAPDQTTYFNSTAVPANKVLEEDNYLIPNQLPLMESSGEAVDPLSSSSNALAKHALKATTKGRNTLQKSKSVGHECGKSDNAKAKAKLPSPISAMACAHHKNPRRRCLRCSSKRDTMMPAIVYDVVVLFSSKCDVSYAWAYYLHGQINEKLQPETGGALRVLIRDVERLYQPTGCVSAFSALSYENQPHEPTSAGSVHTGGVTPRLEASQEHMRAMVFNARLQIILLSKEVLSHVIMHAQDPLGSLLKPERVVALFVGVDERRDINEYHRSALYTFRDWVHIVLENGEIGPIFRFLECASHILQRVPRVVPTPQPAFKLYPRRVRLGESKVMLSLTKGATAQHQASVMVGIREGDMEAAEVLEWVNPWAFVFEVPARFSDLDCVLRVVATVDGKELGVRELHGRSRIRDLGCILTDLTNNPIQILCQAMGVNPVDRDMLDVLLFQQLKQNTVWPGFSWCQIPNPSVQKRNEEFPTLLHFAARYGLERLAWALLEYPGAEAALRMENIAGLSPIGIAEAQNFTMLATCMREYAQVSEYSILVDYMRAARETASMKSASWINRLSQNAHKLSRQPFEMWLSPSEEPPYESPSETQLLPQVSKPDESAWEETRPVQEEGCAIERRTAASYIEVVGGVTREDEEAQEGDCRKHSFQDDLIEIMEEFKNKTVTISEAEQLFHQWRRRMDVEKSMAEKARELEDMRTQFETIQKRLRAGTDQKKQSPFDKLSRFLKRAKGTPTSSRKAVAQGSALSTVSCVDESLPLSCTSCCESRDANQIDCFGSERLSSASTTSAISNSDSGAHSDSDDHHSKVTKDYVQPPAGRFPFTPPTPHNPQRSGISRYQVPPPPRLFQSNVSCDMVNVEGADCIQLAPRPPPRRNLCRSPVQLFDESGYANDQVEIRQTEVPSDIYVLPGDLEEGLETPNGNTVHVDTDTDTYMRMTELNMDVCIQEMLSGNSSNERTESTCAEEDYCTLIPRGAISQSKESLHVTTDDYVGFESESEPEYMPMKSTSTHSISVGSFSDNNASVLQNEISLASIPAQNQTEACSPPFLKPPIYPRINLSASVSFLTDCGLKNEAKTSQSTSMPSSPFVGARSGPPLPPPNKPLPTRSKAIAKPYPPLPPPNKPSLASSEHIVKPFASLPPMCVRNDSGSCTSVPCSPVTLPRRSTGLKAYENDYQQSPPPPRPPKTGKLFPDQSYHK